jgi:hypothetical protein
MRGNKISFKTSGFHSVVVAPNELNISRKREWFTNCSQDLQNNTQDYQVVVREAID